MTLIFIILRQKSVNVLWKLLRLCLIKDLNWLVPNTIEKGEPKSLYFWLCDPNWLLFQHKDMQRQFLNSIACILPTCHIQDGTVQECFLCQGLTLTDLHEPPTCYATGIGDQLGQSFCAAMAQTILKIKFCCCIYCKPGKKDFTENIKAILKLSPTLPSINPGLTVVCCALWLNSGVTLLASRIT